MRTIALINRKGGCGKSTTAVSVAAALGELGQRVLLVDLDPQGSASEWLAGGPTASRDLFDAFVGTRQLADLAEPSRASCVDLVSASSWLVTAERNLQVDLALGAIRALERIPEYWDFVILDCPPTLGYLASAALCAAREAIVPTEAHGLDMSGIESVMEEMERIRGRLNPDLLLTGIVVGRVTRTNHTRDVLAALHTAHGSDVFDQTIRDSIRVPEAAAVGLPVTVYAPTSAVAADVRAVAREVLRRNPDRHAEAPESAVGWRRLVDRLVGTRS
jgi:chromosome partitioning protein